VSDLNPDDIGRDVIPVRYQTESGREAIDLIRDFLGDPYFIAYCRGTAMKYGIRAGKKDGESEDKDHAKAAWYIQMENHVRHPNMFPDPRSNRPGFTPYVRVQP
jgi:hypothetical protein